MRPRVAPDVHVRGLLGDGLGIQVGVPFGELDAKRRPATCGALDDDPPAVQLDELADQGQTDSGALVGAPFPALDAVEALEDARQLGLRDPDAGVLDLQDEALGLLPEPHRDLSPVRELERVRDEVRDDLLPHVAVDPRRLRQRRTVDRQAHAQLVRRGLEHPGQLPREPRDIERRVPRMQASGLEAGEIQESVHELEQAQRAGVRQVQARPVYRRQRGVRERVLQRPEHQRQRSAKLVADVAEEGRLRGVELPQGEVGLAEPAVGLGQLAAAPEDLELHLARTSPELFPLLARAHEVRHLLDAMEDEAHLARRRQDRDVARAPVPRLEGPVGPADVVLLHRHGVGRPRREDAIERRAQVARARRGRIVRVVGEHLEEAAAEGPLARRVGHREAAVGRGHHREPRRVRQEHQQDVGRSLEEEAKVEIRSVRHGLR